MLAVFQKYIVTLQARNNPKIVMVMKHGKIICNTLKQIRLDIARANGIKYAPCECHHEGDCTGTCPACESEMRYLEREIARRRSLGKAALVAGVSLGLAGFPAMAGNSASHSSMTHEQDIQASDTTMRYQVYGMAPYQMPRFPGGDQALMKYLQENIVYPLEAAKNKVQGRVIVQFVVERNGAVGEVKVVRSAEESLDAEAVRVIKTLPKFFPAREGGETVAVWYTLPVTFTLSSDESDD